MIETDTGIAIEGIVNYKGNVSNLEKNNNNDEKKDSEKEIENKPKKEINKPETFVIYIILIVIITMLIFLINIRGFIIPAVGKDWFLPVFLISISFILITILVVGYQNHIKIENESLRLFLVFFFIAQSIILLIIISQFFTHGNTRAPALLSGLLSIMILIWFLLSHKSKVRYLLLIYSFLMIAFAFLLLRTRKIVE